MISPPLFAKLRLILVCLFLLLARISHAATLNVGPGQPYTTIQSAINAANPGDTVLVAPGTYYEHIDFLGKAITVTSSVGPATTIIDGGAIPGIAVVNFHTSELRSSVISGFTIRNGGPAIGTGGSLAAGGIYIFESAPTISNNTISANACYGILSAGQPFIQGNTITNTAYDPATSYDDYCADAAAVSLGGGNPVGNYNTVLYGNTIENNQGRSAGAVQFAGNNIGIQSNIIRNNTGIVSGGISGIVFSNVTIVGNLIYGNTATYNTDVETGGGISLIGGSGPDGPFLTILANNTIAQNSVSNTSPYLNNLAATQVYISGGGPQTLFVNNIITGTLAGTAAVTCDSSSVSQFSGPLVFDHNDIAPGLGVSYSGSCTDQSGAYGNINADPQFINPAAGNFQLSLGSPAIDTGNNSDPVLPAFDLSNATRVQDATGVGYPIVDMGAYEHSGSREIAPTVLGMTPTEYFYPPNYYYPNPTAPLIFDILLSSGSGIPTGPVTLYEDSTVFATVQVGALGTATYSPVALTPGLHAFHATYPGSGIFPAAVSVKFYLYVPLASTTVSLVPNPSPSVVGQPVTFTVTITSTDGSVPTPVTLTDNTTNTLLATLMPNSSGVATYTTSSLTLGVHAIEAAFAGDATHNPSFEIVNQSVQGGTPTLTTLYCFPTTLYLDSNTFLGIRVSSSTAAPTGSVLLTDNAATFGQTTLINGEADYNYTALTVGTHTLTATYIPTGNFAGSSGSCTVTVSLQPSNVALVSSLNPTSVGQSTTFTATVTYGGDPQIALASGTVTFFDGASPLRTVAVTPTLNPVVFTAAYTTTSLAAGPHTITATANPPTSAYASGSASLTQTVIGLPDNAILTASPTAAQYGAPITLTAYVTPANPISTSPIPTGTVTFYNGTTVVGTQALSNFTASAVVSNLPPGLNQLTCSYSGDVTYAPATCPPFSVNINAVPTTLAITSSANPLVGPAAPVTFTEHLSTTSGPLAGQIVGLTYYIGGRLLGQLLTTDSNGNASYTVTPATFPVGSYLIVATFAGAPTLGSSSASLTETASRAPSAITLTATPNPGYQGQNISLTTALSIFYPSSPGLVTLYDGTTALLTVKPGSTNPVLLQFAPGIHTLTAAYAGDAYTLPSTSAPFAETILPSDFTLTSDPSTLTLATGHHLTFTLTAASVGAFADQLRITSANLPDHTTLRYSTQSVALAQNGQATISIYLDTDDVLGYLSSTRQPGANPLIFASLLPLLAFLRRPTGCPMITTGKARRDRGRYPRFLPFLFAILAAGLLTTATGCSGKYPSSTTPGAYTLQLTATGAATQTTHTLKIPFTVTN